MYSFRFFLCFSPLIVSGGCGSGRDEEPSGGRCPPPDSDPFSDAEFGKNPPACQDNSPQARIADSSSRNAVNFSSARTTKRFPSSRCASAIQIVRPLESSASPASGSTQVRVRSQPAQQPRPGKFGIPDQAASSRKCYKWFPAIQQTRISRRNVPLFASLQSALPNRSYRCKSRSKDRPPNVAACCRSWHSVTP